VPARVVTFAQATEAPQREREVAERSSPVADGQGRDDWLGGALRWVAGGTGLAAASPLGEASVSEAAERQSRPPAAAPAAASAAASSGLVAQLVALGFEEKAAAEAARRTSSVEGAVDWILQQGGVG